MAKLTHQQALEAVYTDRLERKGEFVRVPTALFIDKVDVNMPPLPSIAFYELDAAGQPELLRKSDQPYSPLALSNYEHIWISGEDYSSLKRFAELRILQGNAAPGKPGLPLENRMDVLRKSAIQVVEDLFLHPTPENIERSTKVVSSFVYVMMREPQAYLHLSKLSSHDPYTLQHSVGTSVNSIILGRKVGISDEKELNEIGLGGLLHDIGKIRVKREIINKQGPLDELEWEEMRQHSLAGWEIVKDNPSLTERTKRAILEHHEDKNGTGYPHGVKHDQIAIASRIVGLADIFNALTTNRSYSKARTPFDAFQFIREKLGHKVDDHLFKEMVLVYGGKLEATA